MKQCRPDSPTILLRSLFVPDPPPTPPAPLYILGSLPSSLFPLPALHNCSQKQHGPFPSLAITGSLQNLEDTEIKSAIFSGILTFILQGQHFSFFYFVVAKMKVSHKNMCWFCLNSVHFLWEAKPYFLPYFLSPSFMQEVQRGRNFSLKTLNPNHMRLPSTFRV